MSTKLKNRLPHAAVVPGTHCVCAGRARPGETGAGMLEFLLALLIFTTGLSGLLSVQLAGKQASTEAARYSVANHLARDILERMQANPGAAPAYQIEIPGVGVRLTGRGGAPCGQRRRRAAISTGLHYHGQWQCHSSHQLVGRDRACIPGEPALWRRRRGK